MALLSGALNEILVDVGRHLACVQKGHESEVAYLRDQVRKLEDQIRAGSTFEVGSFEAPVREIPCEVFPAWPLKTVSCEVRTTGPTLDLPVGYMVNEETKQKIVNFDVEPKSEPTQVMQVTNTATTKSTCAVDSTKSIKMVRGTTAELNFIRQATYRGAGTEGSSSLARDFAKTLTEVPVDFLGSVPQFDRLRTDYTKLAGRAYWAEQLESSQAELLSCSVIVLNTLLMALELQCTGLQIAHKRGIPGFEAEQDWPHAEEAFFVLEWAFTIFFTIELFIRFVVIQCPFFRKSMNWLDIVVVVISWLPVEDVHMNPTTARLLRLGRIGRALRLFKFSTVLDCLQLILKSIAASVHVLCWSILLLLVIQMIAGMFVGQILASWLDDPDTDPVAREAVFAYYGTFTRIFFTMFEVTLANWPPAARLLIDHVGEHWALFFLVYRCLIGFAVLNVISAIFVQQTMKVAQSDEDVMISQKLRATNDFANKLRKLFVDLDTSGDGLISWEQFEGSMVHPRTQAFMQALEIDVSDLERLYNKLQNRDGVICVDEFAAGIARVKGPAKNIDLVEVLAKVGRLEVQMSEVHMHFCNGGTQLDELHTGRRFLKGSS